ncbi:MAG: hypothetical protein AAF358_13930 [Pseudomonadota bacterium]
MDQRETNTDAAPGRTEHHKSFGYLLVGAALGTVFFMTHHPTSVAGMTGIAGMVHGVMLLMVVALATGLVHFASGLGLSHLPVLTGLICYLAAAIANSLAAVVNGFVFPSLAARGEDEIGHDIFDFAWDLNQALAKLAVYAIALAYMLWSIQLLRKVPRQPWLAGLGLLASVVPVGVLAAGGNAMDVSTALVIYSIQVCWAACVGVTMIRRGR